MNVPELRDLLMAEYGMDYSCALTHVMIAYETGHVEFYYNDANYAVSYNPDIAGYSIGAIEIYCCQWIPYPLPGKESHCDRCGSVFSVKREERDA
jgi:hypothetical protein